MLPSSVDDEKLKEMRILRNENRSPDQRLTLTAVGDESGLVVVNGMPRNLEADVLAHYILAFSHFTPAEIEVMQKTGQIALD